MDSISAPVHFARNQRGYTLVEIMVALLIAVFLLGGLLTVVMDNRRTFTNQSAIAQLTDSQRLAMTIMTNVIQSAGYYPNPTSNTPSTLFLGSPANATSMGIGQAIWGTGDSTAADPGDTLIVRYATVPMNTASDGIILCNGSINPDPAGTTIPRTYINQFSVNNNNQLVCTLDGVAYPLVNGVLSLKILYGVVRNIPSNGNSVDTYVDASNMSPGDWNNVISVMVTLTFKGVPMQGQSQQNANARAVPVTRVIGLMSAGGITIS